MRPHDQEARTAAEVLLTGSSTSHGFGSSLGNISYSINTRSDLISPEDYASGARPGGKMSAVRRFFCLFVTFDLLFTVLMWLICVMLVGDDIVTALKEQVVHYKIRTSLFDIVMASISRFVVLLLFYALLYLNHWSIIALSTGGTCMFLIGKVFAFDWNEAKSPVFQVLLILISFVLAWSEAWFFDFRVVPQESQTLSFLQATQVPENERTPLIRNYLLGVPRNQEYNESVGSFYSPMDSPEGSQMGDDPPDSQTPDYKKKAKEIFDTSWKILNSPGWKVEKQSPNGDIIHSKKISEKTKVYKLTATVSLPPKFLLELLFHRIEEFPDWNPTLKESRRIEIIDDQTDISYQIMAEGGRGLVSSRDFVNLRHWNMHNDSYVIASASIQHPAVPVSKYVRGENGPSCWVMQPIPDDENSCVFYWLLNTTLNVWAPQALLDPAFVSAICDYVKHLRNFAEKLKQEDNK